MNIRTNPIASHRMTTDARAACLFLLVLAILPAVAAASDAPMRLTERIAVQPSRFCGVARFADGRVVQTTDWIEAGGGVPAGASIYDCFDAFTCEEPTDCEQCGFYTLGAEHCNTFAVADMTVEAGCEGSLVRRLGFAWYWYCGGSGSETCYVGVFTGPSFPADCSGPVDYVLESGVVFDFGELGCHPGGVYFTEINLEGSGLDLPLYPGRSAYGLFFARAFDGNNLTPATCAQPALWSANGLTSGVERAGSNGPLQYDDTNRDGAHDPSECNNYAVGRCPDPLTAVVAFRGDAGGECTGEEAISKARCRSGGKVVVKVIRGVVGEPFQVRLDTGEEAEGEFNSRSKGKVKFNGVSSGRNAATATFACGDTDVRVFDCP